MQGEKVVGKSRHGVGVFALVAGLAIAAACGQAKSDGSEDGDDAAGESGAAGNSVTGGRAGSSSGGRSTGGSSGSGAPDDHCEVDSSSCICLRDPNDVWPPDSNTCRSSSTMYCCADSGYPSTGTCTCNAWSCIETAARCQCNDFAPGGQPSCLASFVGCCRSATTNNCRCDNLGCSEGEIEVPNCTIDVVECILTDDRLVTACREGGATGGTGGDGASGGSAGSATGGSSGDTGGGGLGANGGSGGGSGGARGGTGGAGTGGAGSGGGGGAPLTCDTAFAVNPDGFVRAPGASGCWHGYAFAGGDTGSFVMPTSFATCGTGCMLRVSGTLNAATVANSYAGVVYVGFNINQAAGGSIAGSVTPTGANLVVTYTKAMGPASIRAQIQSANGIDRWCVTLPPSPATIPYSSFNTACWDNSGTAYAKQPIAAFQLVAPGEAASMPIDMTIVSIRDL